MRSARFKRRPAVLNDIVTALGAPPPVTVRAWVLEDDEGVAAIGGYFIAGSVAVVFSDMIRPLPGVIAWRSARWLMNEIGLPMVTVAEEGSGPFLERLGWSFVGPSKDGDVYACSF